MDLQRREPSVVVGVELDELLAALVDRPRWVEHRMGSFDSACEGLVFIQRRDNGFVVWTRDREDPDGQDAAALRVVASPDPQGTRLKIRPVPTRRSRVALGLTPPLRTATGRGLRRWVENRSIVPRGRKTSFFVTRGTLVGHV